MARGVARHAQYLVIPYLASTRTHVRVSIIRFSVHYYQKNKNKLSHKPTVEKRAFFRERILYSGKSLCSLICLFRSLILVILHTQPAICFTQLLLK